MTTQGPAQPCLPAAGFRTAGQRCGGDRCVDWNDELLPVLEAAVRARADDAAAAETSKAAHDAMRALVAVSSGTLMRMVQKVQRDPHEAEDVLQTVFMKLWMLGGSFDPARGSARHWLTSIAHNAAVDSLRRGSAVNGALDARGGGRDVPDRGHVELEQLPCQRVGAFEQLAATARCNAVQQSLRQLPANPRHLLQLSLWGGMSHGQLAAHLGQPLGTVKSTLRRSYAQLRPLLEDHR